ncbi:hypothetical protein pqer_cds_275 [Pandoravirus quercus]|uniref:Uncharacterized protein n=2 Tax=Pandoravirus TaxID=2060084 RepID=A0A2U7U8D6_9VIRU|nr:hypothetical protein pqer_cds_275 [Pandoravirus quercus]AVK74697.1 hypothetical protein pqer_cds_275 [Pandoravirus quercus]QBZ80874.1 hypothetical protein pclt_cds_276 [Pandoravirus celtis]
MASAAAFNRAQSAQQQQLQQQQFQQLQQQALMQALANQQAGQQRPRREPNRLDGQPRGSTAPSANAGRRRPFGPGAGAVPATDPAALQWAAQQANAPRRRRTAQAAGPVHGRHIGGFATGTPISATGEEAVEEFLQQYSDCPNLTRESLVGFLSTVDQLGYNAEDLRSAMRTLFESNVLGAALPDLQRKSRWGGGVFAAQVIGTRGANREKPLPSTLWYVASTYCNILDRVTVGLEDIANGTFANEALDGPLPAANTLVDQPTLNRINAELAAFLASHSECAPDEEELRWFLAMVDRARTNGRTMSALLRAFGLEGRFPDLFSQSDVRFADAAFTPATTGVSPETFNRIKRSLLWSAAERYCREMGPFDQFIYNIVTGRAAQGLAVPQAGGVVGTAAGFKPDGTNGNGFFGGNAFGNTGGLFGGSAGAGGAFGGSANGSRVGSGTFGTPPGVRPMSR